MTARWTTFCQYFSRIGFGARMIFEDLKYLKSVFDVAERGRDLDALDRIAHLEERLAGNVDAFFAGVFLALVGRDPHSFEDVGRYIHARNLVVHKLGIPI